MGTLRTALRKVADTVRARPHPLRGVFAGSSWVVKVTEDGGLLGRMPGNGAFMGRAGPTGAVQLTVAQHSWFSDDRGRRQRLEYTDRLTGRIEMDQDGDIVLRLDIGGAYALYRVIDRRGPS